MLTKLIKKLNQILSRRNQATVTETAFYDRDKIEEIQAFVYKDLDLIKKKTARTAYIKNLPQPLSEEAIKKIKDNKMELSREIDRMLREKQLRDKKIAEIQFNKLSDLQNKIKKQYSDISPIPRHPSTPKDNETDTP
jgi:hypothetical protein